MVQTQTPASARMVRRFVPADLDPADWGQLEPLYQALRARPVETGEQLAAWLLDASELTAVVSEYRSRVFIDKACHTEDKEIERRYLHLVEQILPKLKPAFFELQKRYLASPGRGQLDRGRYAVLDREWQADVELFRPENVPLQTQEAKLIAEYDKVCGAMLVNFRGTEYTLQQLARFSEDPDRATREEAWQLAEQRRLADRGKMEELFEQLLGLRAQIARNAELPDFRAYIWKAMARFDYRPEDCLRFDDAIAETIVPRVRALDEARRADLKVDKLRPWDLAVDPQGRPALRPFAPEKIDEFVARTGEVFRRIHPRLAEEFATLQPGRNLDLGSRKGKRPGGFQSSLEESREPFIFMNAAGLQRDVETLLHEGGHAFHYLAARHEPLVFLRHAPLEFCEVASMGMELLGAGHFGVFYGEENHEDTKAARRHEEEKREEGRERSEKKGNDAARAKRKLLEGIVRFLPWMATIDAFQHWLYTHPGHSAGERAAAWLEIYGRFSSGVVDWNGLEEVRAGLWLRQLHLFHHPFYYIEYGIAQLGALQVWSNYRRDPEPALARLRAAFALGGTRPLPELFAAAGIRFEFTRETLEPLVAMVEEELGALPR